MTVERIYHSKTKIPEGKEEIILPAPAQGPVALLYGSDNQTEEEIRKIIPFITGEKRRKTQPLH